MYSKKRNCAASLFPKQNSYVLSPHFHIHIFPGSACLFGCSKIGRPILGTLMYELNQGPAVSFLGIHKSDFRYSVSYKLMHISKGHSAPAPRTMSHVPGYFHLVQARLQSSRVCKGYFFFKLSSAWILSSGAGTLMSERQILPPVL
jgi:hypothetical protein